MLRKDFLVKVTRNRTYFFLNVKIETIYNALLQGSSSILEKFYVGLTDPLSWKDDINRETSSALFITCFIALGNWCPFL